MNFNIAKLMRHMLSFVLICLTACGGGGTSSGNGGGGTSSGNGGTTSYTIGGAVTGLTSSVILQNNGGDNLTVSANGNFAFASKIATGSTYSVTVLTQPAGQICSVSTGAGTVSGGNVTNVAVVCATNHYGVGGTISGLIGSVVLQDNTGDNLSVSANGTFTFATHVANGSPYSVTVLTHPASQSCSVARGTGTISLANVSNVSITCATNTYTIGGTVTGLSGSMVLQDNGGDNLTVATNGSFTFTTAVAYGNPYKVTVLTPPTGQLCTLTGGSGTVTANVTSVAVNCVASSAPTLALFAGQTNVSGSANGNGTAASFFTPIGVATDGTGNVYVGDSNNSTIRKITPAGVVTTFAGTAGVIGSADGTGAAASFSRPTGVAADSVGNVYVADTNNSTIRKITPSGVVSTLAGTVGAVGSADGTGAAARFSKPWGVAVDSAGNVYVADTNNGTIRKVTPTGVVSTLAGTAGVSGSADGTGAAASFRLLYCIAVDTTGNSYVADYQMNTIRKITPTGVVTTLAGTAGVIGSADGTGAAASFFGPSSIVADSLGNLYVTDTFNYTIRKITPAGVVTTVVGVAGQLGFVPGPLPGKLQLSFGIAATSTSLYATTNQAIAVVSPLP